jgi:hypothetical protein
VCSSNGIAKLNGLNPQTYLAHTLDRLTHRCQFQSESTSLHQ